MEQPSVRLPTASGQLEIKQAKDAGECISCHRSGGGMARVTTDTSDKVYRVCGQCVSTALAVHFRTAHKTRRQTGNGRR
jgi:hypothetical protein